MQKTKFAGFSLVELLIALIVISVITAAMAPTLTKKARQSKLFMDFTHILTDKYEGVLLRPGAAGCTTDASGVTKCSVTIPDNVTKVNAIVVGGGGGGGGASAYSQTEGTYSVTSGGSQTFNIGKDAVDVKIKSMTGGGGGGGGGSITNMNKNIAKTYDGCNAWAEEIRARTGSRPDIYFLANQCIFITWGDVYSDTKNIHEVCRNDNPVWQDTKDEDWKLASKSWIEQYVLPQAKKDFYYDWYIFKDRDNGCYPRRDYSVKNYTSEMEDKYECINGWNATTKQCDGLDAGDLHWGDTTTYLAADGGYGKRKTTILYKGTDDEYEDWAPAGPIVYYLNYYYADGTYNPDTGYYSNNCTNTYRYAGWRQAGQPYGYVEGGVKYHDTVPLGNHMAVCLFGGTIADKNYYGGGGGGGGVYVENIEIPSYVISGSDGKIKLTAGAGGSGGSGGSLEYTDKGYYNKENPPYDMTLANNKYFYGKNGGAGGTSSVSIGSWSYSVAGGHGGYATTGLNANYKARGGEGGKCAKDYSKCFDGNTGNNPEAKATDAALLVKFEGSYGGSGGSSLNRTYYGTGGRGGEAGKYTDPDTVEDYVNGIDYSTTSGSSGSSGSVYVTYAKKIRAGGGGGGGGAGYALVKDITVTPKATYNNIVVGSGGTGGGIGAKGANGQNSSITIGSMTCTVGGGTGGGYGSKAANATSFPTHGTGGAAGGVSCTTADSYAIGARGGNGAQSGSSGEHGSQGGCGGDSGIGAQGGHGGNNYSRGHKNALVNGLTTVFEAPSILIAKILMGSAGAGGGGGGWSSAAGNYTTPGVGGDGQDGYIYIYWKKK